MSRYRLPFSRTEAVVFFPSTYVKWIESAGGRVVPLLYDATPAELDTLLGSVNGVLIAGGNADMTDLSSQYMRTVGHVLNRTLEANAAGTHLPLWGTCGGMQSR